MKKIWIFILVLIIAAGGFVWFSPIFERIPPEIKVNSNGFTNLKNPIKISINDNRGIKYYSVTALINGNAKVLVKKSGNFGKSISLDVKLPQIASKKIKLIIDAVDTSEWNWFAGNEAKKEVTLKVDTIAPDAEIVNNSYAIGNGGSAAVVVKVADANLKAAYILVDNKYKFKLTPFYKKNYYVALIAWPVKEKTFEANLVAIDYAGNKSIAHIPLYWRHYKYPDAKIIIDDNYIKNKAIPILQKMNVSVPNDPVSVFKKENEYVRKLNNEEIYKLTSKIYEDKINSFSLAAFNPLPGSLLEAYFGERRHYFYKNKLISNSIHLGIDVAKIKRAKIYASNYGKVAAEKWIGIYGNTLIIYHNLGLYSLYAHTSEFDVPVGASVRRGEVIARTGNTGGAIGDHLHFGLYIQGIAVNPFEWMDRNWIRVNIINIINSSKRLIGK
ncbi:M23 family metallopeptidase [Lebetimonas sp. JS138]|uniref:M23 family metallopeptidase n=1 Tax=Lebetimonas sp. JS138 TaxID=990072 RepID=UPI0004643B59|nr:M23 family metallopeptidase [Lebetimonas sp. JS138]